MYVLKNLSRLDNRPAALREKIFTKLFDAAAIARFSPTELREYEDSLKAYRDIKNSLDTAKAEGRAEGRAEGKAEGKTEERSNLIKTLYEAKFTIDEISRLLKMEEDVVEKIVQEK